MGEGGGAVHKKRKIFLVFFYTKKQNGHQFKGNVIRIIRIEAFYAAQSQLIVEILGHLFGGAKMDMA
jgi:hypothetical protein